VSQYDGRFYSVPPSRMAPKPVQRPGPPVLLGGSVATALQRAGRIAAGWISRSAADLYAIANDVAVVRSGAEKAGRDPAGVRIVCRGVVRYGEPVPDEQGRRRLLSGSFEQIRRDADWLDEQGVTELFFDLNWDPLVGSPDADPASALRRAEDIVEALAP